MRPKHEVCQALTYPINTGDCVLINRLIQTSQGSVKTCVVRINQIPSDLTPVVSLSLCDGTQGAVHRRCRQGALVALRLPEIATGPMPTKKKK